MFFPFLISPHTAKGACVFSVWFDECVVQPFLFYDCCLEGWSCDTHTRGSTTGLRTASERRLKQIQNGGLRSMSGLKYLYYNKPCGESAGS